MSATELAATARGLVAEGKGILAADESTPTITKRLDAIGVEATEETRRGYRELLFTTEGIGEHISGVIMYDETIRQSAADGTPFVKLLAKGGVMSGIKVDTGAKALAKAPGEKVTEGLDGLRGRLEEYASLGARFTKWRAVITIGDGIPSATCIEANAHALGRFAALSQEAGLVPIVEPEVLMDGGHDIDACAAVTEKTLERVFLALFEHRVALEGMLLKPNMVISGKDCSAQAGAEAVAAATIQVFRRVVPSAVPGVVFLSGGQSEVEASANLNALNALAAQAPWQLSFSYGRALQQSALKAWGGKAGNVAQAQAALRHRARMNGAARTASYAATLEEEAAA